MQQDRNMFNQMRFPQKLWHLLDQRTDASIMWGGTGRTILINNKVLLNYLRSDLSIFKTMHVSSFIRQLNLYGFRKVTSHLQDPLCNSSNPYMHEYIHDYFQYDRPDLLNRITRKPLTVSRNNTKNICKLSQIFTPLQKARRNLQLALKKAAENLYIQQSTNQLYNISLECENEGEERISDGEENMEFEWTIETGTSMETAHTPTNPEYQASGVTDVDIAVENADSKNYENSNDCYLIEYVDTNVQKNDSENFSIQFLNMPELDPIPADSNESVELLASFEINNGNDELVNEELTNDDLENKENDMNTLNCVLPSISNDRNDDTSIIEKENTSSDHYHGDWDQMFHEIMGHRASTQECSSEFKDLYSQISKTIDLLNS